MKSKRKLASAMLIGLSVACLFCGGLLNKNYVSATDLPVVYESGDIWSDETWTNDSVHVVGSTTIENGATVTIEPGTIVKYQTGWYGYSITVSQGGTLDAEGTSVLPITFTSLNDDSAGGDSNANGASSGSANDYSQAIVNANGHVVLTHASIKYVTTAINDSCSSATSDLAATDNSFQGGVSLGSCDSSHATVARNSFDVTGWGNGASLSYADLATLPLSGTDENIFSGTGQAVAVRVINGGLDSGETWGVDSSSGAVLVPSNAIIDGDVTIDAGVVVKGTATVTPFVVAYDGTMTVAGSSTSPVTFTSANDDSVGGDTLSDGPTTGSFGDYSQAINSYGSLNVSFAVFRYAQTAISTAPSVNHPGTVVLADNTFKSGVSINGSMSVPAVLQRNVFDAQQWQSLYVSADVSGIVMSGANKNTFTGSDQAREFLFYNSSVPDGSSWTMDSSGGAIFVLSNFSVDGTLDIAPGTIIKSNAPTGGIVNVGRNGSLDAEGTSLSPITFTSLNDDSIGGDTGGDGSTSGSFYDASMIIADYGGLVTTKHAAFSNAEIGFTLATSSTYDPIDLEDNTFNTHVTLNNISGDVTLKRNHFNTPHDIALSMYRSKLDANIPFSGTDKNTVSGSGQAKVVRIDSGTIGSGDSWDISDDSGAVFELVNIVVNGTANINAGTIIKGAGSPVFSVGNSGDLEANSSGSHIIITSLKDDSYGGDSNGDGSSTSPSAGDYGYGIETSGSAVVNANNIDIKYAQEAVYTSTGGSVLLTNATLDHNDTAIGTSVGQVAVRGTITDTTSGHFAIVGCNWGASGCGVDAAYVDWGSADGPFPSGGDLVCGKVSVSPWTHSSSSYSGNIFSVPDCGSSTAPFIVLQDDISAFKSNIAAKQIDCDNSVGDACNQIDSAYACLSGAMATAQSTAPITIPPADTAAHVNDFASLFLDSASGYIDGLETASVGAFSTSVFSGLHDVVTPMLTAGYAYSSCAP